MKARLTNHIVCPIDKSPLAQTVTSQAAGEIMEGMLTCDHGHTYPIRDGVPNLVPQQDKPQDFGQTTDTFSKKWTRVPDFGHEEKSRDMYIQWYLERYGHDTLDGLRSFLSGKSKVLDAGTGLGRDTRLYADNCDGEIFGIDISDSIDFAYEHVGHLPNVHILRADLTQLPFPESSFDFIACDQVIHHTVDTSASFRHLAAHLVEGGHFATYVYKQKAPIREFCDDLLREQYTQSSEEECLKFCEAITELGRSLHELKIDFDVPSDIPALGITAGKHNLQRFIYWHMFKCFWNEDFSYDLNVMANYDWYRPKYAHRHTPEELRQWCNDEGLEIENFDIVEAGVSVRARRAASASAAA